MKRSHGITGLDQPIVHLVRWPVFGNDQQQMPREACTQGKHAAMLLQNIYLQPPAVCRSVTSLADEIGQVALSMHSVTPSQKCSMSLKYNVAL